MSEWQLQTPVAVIIFNRPDTTRSVFEVLRQVKPPKLLIVADGARLSKLGEAEQCAATRAIFERIDWPCEVLTNYAETNLGCGWRLSSGLDWVFAQVPEAIILEDDCLPHPTFFRFCSELLERYRNDERVMHISGTNFLFGAGQRKESYYFSRYPQVWGWASWRRAWQHYDFLLRAWPEVLARGWLNDVLEDAAARQFWQKLFEQIYLAGQNKGAHTWDYQWDFACWMQHGLSITPRLNLVSNIGFGTDATHTLAASAAVVQVLSRLGVSPHSAFGHFLQTCADRLTANRFAKMPVEPMPFPLDHPTFVIRDSRADEIIQRRNYQGGALSALKRMIKKRLLKLPHGDES